MDQKSKKQLVNDYRKAKKINKSKIRDGKKRKDFMNDESSILNALPSGAFEQNIISKNDTNNDKLTTIVNDTLELKNEDSELGNELVDEEEYEKFNDDYFKQQTI